MHKRMINEDEYWDRVKGVISDSDKNLATISREANISIKILYRCNNYMSLSTLKKFCRYMNVKADYILGLNGCEIPNKEPSNLKDNILYILDYSNSSKKDIGNMYGISPSFLTKKDVGVSMNTLYALCDASKVSADWVIGLV